MSELTESALEAMKWLTAFPDLARELIAANALMREDGSFGGWGVSWPEALVYVAMIAAWAWVVTREER